MTDGAARERGPFFRAPRGFGPFFAALRRGRFYEKWNYLPPGPANSAATRQILPGSFRAPGKTGRAFFPPEAKSMFSER